jgi:putative copper export protein
MSTRNSTFRALRLSAVLATALMALMAFAPGAFAADGIGLYGPASDKVVVYFSFGIMILVATVVIVATLIQMRFDKRKEQRKEALDRLESDKT